ncbi:MAG: undecaprenyl-diphosphate phosphatase [Haliscomenobacter sp.]|nr:undecaprenyl-diphosphate phosphatase [Haliscomenobacter sp.]MBK8878811.1 undecaprenyl-diphosphate phosphatase [Haliscomenobacter sp.]
MELLKAALLGIIQGLTEFLPVSSSGHLELAKYLLGDQSVGEESLLMTVTLHFGTALATLAVFRKELAQIFKGLFRFQWNEETIFSSKIVVSMIPAALVGVFLEDQIEMLFNRQVLLVGACLVVTGLLLFWANRSHDNHKPIGFNHAFWVGIAQAIAILPGISRSGATISSALLLGIDREKATRFSFLMVVPLIIGKMSKDMLEGDLSSQETQWLPLVVGFVFAFLFGFLACTWMIQLVKRSKLIVFAVYCLLIGSAAVVYALLTPGLH